MTSESFVIFTTEELDEITQELIPYLDSEGRLWDRDQVIRLIDQARFLIKMTSTAKEPVTAIAIES